MYGVFIKEREHVPAYAHEQGVGDLGRKGSRRCREDLKQTLLSPNQVGVRSHDPEIMI